MGGREQKKEACDRKRVIMRMGDERATFLSYLWVRSVSMDGGESPSSVSSEVKEKGEKSEDDEEEDKGQVHDRLVTG
jgi:hypothetical protein